MQSNISPSERLLGKVGSESVTNSSKLQFRPRARIIRTIGDQLISGPEAALIELVKNAYDADASEVTIAFTPPLWIGEGRITVSDDGHGMTLGDIQDKWMEPATMAKVGARRSPVKGRQMMGSKGIGRFAAAKLGDLMALHSISERTGVRTEVLIPELNWGLFEGDTYLSDISIDYLTQPTELPTGTTIEITSLTENWSEAKLARLHLELRRLMSPLDSSAGTEFKIFLDLSAITEETAGFSGRELLGNPPKSSDRDIYEVQPFPLLSSSDYEVEGRFDEAGQFVGTLEIRRAGRPPQPISITVPLGDDEEPCGRVGVHLFLFDRETAAIRGTIRKSGLGEVSAAEARRILDSIAGIAIYRDGFRVRPYGDPENDWLVLDQRRVQNPSLRIGHNQVAGFVSVEPQENSGLLERSSREGFEQGGAFRRLQHLILSLLSEAVEPNRQVFREDAGLSRSRSVTFGEVKRLAEMEKLRKLIPSLPADEQQTATNLIDQQSSLLAEKIEVLEDRQRILEAQSSLGAIIAEVLHEGGPSASFLAITASRLQTRFQHLFDNSSKTVGTRQEFTDKLPLMNSNAAKLQRLFVALRPLAGIRRSPPVYFYGIDIASDVIEIFHSHKVDFQIAADRNTTPQLLGYPDDLNTALVNLVNNSVYWLESSRSKSPTIKISFIPNEHFVRILVEDNGPGIPEEFESRIFDVGFTLRNGGTGLGLNIAREALERSGATLALHQGRKNGTRFEIQFPR